MEHLQTFGSKVWHKIRQERAKFDPKGKEGIFIGYSKVSKAYIVWDERSKKAELTRDVLFDETIFPAKCQKSIEAVEKDCMIFLFEDEMHELRGDPERGVDIDVLEEEKGGM